MNKDTETIMGTGYISYDHYREFSRMVAAFDELMELNRTTMHCYFDSQELTHLADMRDFLYCVSTLYDNPKTVVPVVNDEPIDDVTRRGSTVAQVCAATLKLIDRAFLANPEKAGYPHSYSELADFCRWQWLNQDMEVERLS